MPRTSSPERLRISAFATCLSLSAFSLVSLVLFFTSPAVAQAVDDGSAAPGNTYKPLDRHERWENYLQDNYTGRGPYFRASISALSGQLSHTPPEWGGNAASYGHRVTSEFARFSVQGTIQASAAAALDYDTRYLPCRSCSFPKRLGTAVSRTFVTRDRTGHQVVDIPGIAGIYGGSIVETRWYPDRYQVEDGFRSGNIELAVQTGINLIKEFGPDLRRLVRHGASR